MPRSPYRGETIEKKLARLFFWLAVREHIGEALFKRGPYLGLASEEAGDAATLLGLGVPPDRIVLAELDPHACAAARIKFPHVQIFCENVEKTATRYFFMAAFLDYCGLATRQNIDLALHVGHSVKLSGLLGVGVHVGRETGELGQRMNQQLERKKRQADASFHVRADHLSKELSRDGWAPFHLFSYVSDRPKRHVPMCVYLGTRTTLNMGKVPCTHVPRGHEARRVFANWFSSFDRRGMDVALIFNISRGSVAAMRAHITRGTYA